jgi:hypothetical protein
LKQLGIDPESALETLIVENQNNGSGSEGTANGIEGQKLEARKDLCLKDTQIFESMMASSLEKSSQKRFKPA